MHGQILLECGKSDYNDNVPVQCDNENLENPDGNLDVVSYRQKKGNKNLANPGKNQPLAVMKHLHDVFTILQ